MKPYYEHAGITIYHGDCREVLPTLDPVDLVLTDPPYGIALSNHDTVGGFRRPVSFKIAGDESMDIGKWALEQFDGTPTIAFASPMKPWPGRWRQFLVWDKGPAVGGGGDTARLWKMTWELIQYRDTGILSGSRDSAVLRHWVTSTNNVNHPAAKPVDLLMYLIEKATTRGQTIADPFMGSGSTLAAAKETGRRAIGIEIEERYCEVAANRLRQEVLFGVEATVASG